MKINDVNGVIRQIDPRDAQKTGQSPIRPAGQEIKSADGDSLDLSASARISAGSVGASAAAATEETSLTPARIAEIKSRIQSGFYDQPGPASDIAARVLNFYAR
jgi:anti-sigma28 factor (negative regulator of flagellin synthesis)